MGSDCGGWVVESRWSRYNKKYKIRFIFIAEMYTKPTVYPPDYSCILDPQGDRGGLYIGNLEAAQSTTILQSKQPNI